MVGKIRLGAIVVFYIIAVICRFIAVKTHLFSGISNQYFLILLRGIGPALGAFAALSIFRIPADLSLKGIYKNIVTPLTVYWLVAVLLISTVTYFTTGEFPALFMLTVLIYGLLEEIGWRVFLQQQLEPLPKFYNILITAILWFSWHLNFEPTTPNLVFLGIIFLGTWGIGKVYDKTASLLAVAAFHSLNNFFRNGLLNTQIILIFLLLIIWIGFIIWYNKKHPAQNNALQAGTPINR